MLNAGPLLIASPREVEEACFSVPAVRALRFADLGREVLIACEEEMASFWRTIEGVTVVPFPNRVSARKVAKMMPAVDQVLLWQDGAFARGFYKAKVARRMGPKEEKSAKWLTDEVEVAFKPGPVQHRVRYYLRMAELLGAAAYEEINFQSPSRALPTASIRIALVPGSAFGPSAEWGVEKFHELATLFSVEWVILESPGRSQVAGKFTHLGEVVSYREVLEVLRGCHYLVGNDDVIPHLAAHLGVPSVVIFGPNDPDWKRPLGTVHRVVHERVPCSSCLLAKCPQDHRCLDEISVERVAGELRKLMAQKNP
jgi:ADP-heptose:LPS heptosyltransferase